MEDDPYSTSSRASSYQLLSWLAQACHERHVLHRTLVRRSARALDSAINLGRYGAVPELLNALIAAAIAAARWRALGTRFKLRARAMAAGNVSPLSPAAHRLAWRLLIGRPISTLALLPKAVAA